MINILDIPDQYFFVWDRARHEAAIDGLKFLSGLEKEDSDEKRDELERRITPVVGFRQAEKLKTAKPEEIRGTLWAIEERQQHLKAYLEERFETAKQRAAARYPDSEEFRKQEVRRDAVFYTLARSGLMLISDVLVGNEDWERVSEEIVNGQRLDRYLPPEIIDLTRDLLPHAILFNQQRDDLKTKLRNYGLGDKQITALDRALPQTINVDLPEEQREQVNTMLQRCVSSEADFEMEFCLLESRLGLNQQQSQELKQKLKKVVKGSGFRLARGLEGLRFGRVNTNVLIASYKFGAALNWYPLGEEVSRLELRDDDKVHVHPRNSRYTQMILSSWLNANKSMPIKLINSLDIGVVSRWCTSKNGSDTLDPKLDIDPRILGQYIGHFLFGRGNIGKNSQLSYSPKTRDRGWFLDLIEKTGSLTSDPSMHETPLKNIHRSFGRESDIEGATRDYTVPKRFLDLTRYAFEHYKKVVDPHMATASLEAWIMDRLSRSYGKAIEVTMRPEHEPDIRRMSEQIGLNVSKGRVVFNRKIVYIRNPEVVGYRA